MKPVALLIAAASITAVQAQKPPVETREAPPTEAGAKEQPAEERKTEPNPLHTQCEQTGFKEYTSYDNQLAYLRRIQATSTTMKSGFYGETWQKRGLPYVVFSRPTVTQPWEAMVLGKPIIMFQGNVHGGERTLRESLLILIRELATEGTDVNGYLDEITVLIAPQVNPDGFSAARPTRGNAWGIDLNRDYMKLEHPAVASLVRNVYHRWHPHLIVDGHNGGARPYNLNYITSGNAAPDQTLVDLCNQKIFPLVGKRLEEKEMKAFYYPGGNREYWRGAPTYPRICMSYACLAGALGITFESPRQSIEDGVMSGLHGFKAVLEYAALNPDTVVSTVNRARRQTIALGEKPGGEVMVDMKAVDQDYTVSYLVRDGDGWAEVESGKLRTKPVVTKSRPRPYAYVLPRQARATVELLRRHNITVEVLEEPTTIKVDAYVAKDIRYRRAYDHAASVAVEIDSVATLERYFPAGSFVVPTAQMMGRVVTYLLEPETDDNVISWNTMDALLPQSELARARARATPAAAAAAAAAPPAATDASAKPPAAGGAGAGEAAAGEAAAGEAAAGAAGRARSARADERRGRAGGQRADAQGRGERGAGRQGAQGRGERRARQGRRGGRFFSGRSRTRRETRPILPIYKIMKPTPLATRMID